MPLPAGFELEGPEVITEEPISKVPEGFELEVERRPLLTPDLPNYLKFKLNADKAHSERSKYGQAAMWGKIDTQEALTKGNEARDYWMTQAGPYEDLSFKKHPFKYVAGETVQLLPYMISSQVEGLKYGMTLGGGFAAITAAAGQVPPLTFLPEEVITVPTAFAGGMATGYSYGVIKNILDREGGGLYLDMAEKGISPETARPLALAGGTLIGIIELMQFKLLGKPFKQAFSKVVKSNLGKKAITQAMGRYLKTVGGEMLEEELQEITSLVTETIAGVIDEKPDAMPTREEWQARLLETAARAGAGLAVISVPGAAVDITTSMRLEKIVKKKEDIALLDKIISELKGEEVKEKKLEAPIIKEIKPTPEGLPLAIRLKSGEVITDPTAKLHSDIIANKDINPEDVQDVGIMEQKPIPEEEGKVITAKDKIPTDAMAIFNRTFYYKVGKQIPESFWENMTGEKLVNGLENLGLGEEVLKDSASALYKAGYRKIGNVFITEEGLQLSQGKYIPTKLPDEKGGEPLETLPEVPKEVLDKARGLIQEKPKITPERIKPDISGITPLQKQIQAMEDRLGRVEIAKDALEEIETQRDFLKRRITKYKDAYLKEELTGIPSIYIIKEGGIKPDEAIQELRNRDIEVNNEEGLKEYLQDLEKSRKDLIAEIKTYKPEFITKRETTLLADKIKAVEMGVRKGRIQTKEEIIKTQAELIEVIEDADLEAKDKAKFLRTIKNIQTRQDLAKQLPKVIERLQSLREASERTEIISDLRDLFERQPTKNLPIEYKDLIEDIKSKFLLKKVTEQAKRRLESMRQFVERMAEQGEEINIPEEKLALLEKTSTDEMTTQELRDLKETIQRLYHQGRLKNKLLTVLQERNFGEIKTEMINIITQGKGLSEDSSIIRALREQNKNLKDKSLDAIKNYIIENMRPELMLNILDGGEPGIISNTLFNSLWEAQKAELQESQKTSDTIKDIHKNLNFAELFTKKYDIGRFKGMTKDQALFIYANSFNDSNMLHLIGSGITDEDISAIEKFLSVEEKQAVKDMIRYYDEYQYPLLDRIFVDLEGVHLGKEEQYFPIDRVEDISYNKELEKDILERNYIRRPGVSKGFTKERVSSTKGFSEFSYFGTILRNHRKVEHYKAFAKSIRDANKILNNPEIRASVKEKAGEKYFKTLDKWLKDVAYGMDKQSMDTTEKLIQWLRTNYAVAVIGGNLLSVMKAPISFIQGAEMAGKWNTTKALFKFILAPLDWNVKIDEKSVLMKYRPMRQERELGEIVSQRSLKGQIDKVTGMQLIREKSMLPWVVADKTTCDIIWLAAYEEALSDNMTEQQAVDHADMVIRRTQPMSGALNLPDTFRGREYQKLFTLFRNQPNQNFNLLLESVLKKQRGKIGATEFLSNQVFYLIVPAVIIGLINRKRLPEDLGEFAKDVLNGALGGLIYIGNVTSMLASGFMGATTPIESLFEDFYNFYRSKDAWKKLDNFVDMVSKLIGVPYLAVKRIVTGKPLGKLPKTKEKGLEPI